MAIYGRPKVILLVYRSHVKVKQSCSMWAIDLVLYAHKIPRMSGNDN